MVAVTADTVSVELEAKTQAYLSKIAAADTEFTKRMQHMAAAATKAGNASAVAFDPAAGAFQRVGTAAGRASRGMKVVDGQLQQVGRRFGAAGNQVGNLGAQINDIGVTLASGQSPFLVAIQQGSQINQVIGHMGAAGAVRALAASFTSLINPVSLATFAIIGLGGTAVQYFSQLITSTDEANEKLKDHGSVIQRVADEWGDALPALKAYAEELRRASEAEDLRTALSATIGAEFENLEGFTENIRGEIQSVISEMRRLGRSEQEISVLQSQFTRLESAIDDLDQAMRAGEDTTDEMANVSSALASILGNNMVEGSDNATSALNRLSEAMDGAIARSQELNNVLPLLTTEEMINREGKGTRSSRPLSPGEERGLEFRLNPDLFGGTGGSGSGGRGGGGGTSAIEREREAVAKLIETLEHERSLIGLSEVERKKANALRKAGAAATDEQRQKIAALTETIYNEKTALKHQEQAFEDLKNIGVDAISSIANAFSDGKLEAEELIGILANVASQLLRMKSLGGGGGGFFGQVLGALIPGFANGTNYAPGGMALVGEKGPELVNLPRGSQVVPNQRIDMGGTTVVINAPINAPGADPAQLARVEQSVKQLERNVPKMVDKRVNTKDVRKTRA